jgi:hypothetical protein
MDGIEGLVSDFGQWVHGVMPDGVLRSLLVDGVIAGTGAVVVFLPQILILFFFILVLEDSGYLPRAAFCWTASWAAWACPDAPSSRCCPALPAPCPASWPRVRSPAGATVC